MSESPPDLIDRSFWLTRRDRAARSIGRAQFLHDLIADEAADRISEINRAFPRALVFGAGPGTAAMALKGRFGIETLEQIDPAPAMAALSGAQVADERFTPEPNGYDLIAAPLFLHWLDDLPGALIRIRRALKPDGLFLGAIPARRTLFELRESLGAAEIEIENGLSPRVIPMADLRDLGGLLQRAGFALPVADSAATVIDYPHPLAAMRDLQAMGDVNALTLRRRGPINRAVLARAIEIYADRFARIDGRVPATVEIAWLTGWAPSPDQPKPLRPGSATARLADALGATEIPTGDAPNP